MLNEKTRKAIVEETNRLCKELGIDGGTTDDLPLEHAKSRIASALILGWFTGVTSRIPYNVRPENMDLSDG